MSPEELIEFSDSTSNCPREPSTVQTTNRLSIHEELQPKAGNKPEQQDITSQSFSKKFLRPTTLPKPGHRLIPSKPILPPKPGTRSTAVQHDAKSIHTAVKTPEETVLHRRV